MSSPSKTITLIVLTFALSMALAACGDGTTTVAPSPPVSTPPDAGSTRPADAPPTVEIGGFAFSPATIEIELGDSVTWTNLDAAAHTVVGTGIDSGDLAQGATFTKTFETAGTYDYHCSLHPSMTGVVVVK